MSDFETKQRYTFIILLPDGSIPHRSWRFFQDLEWTRLGVEVAMLEASQQLGPSYTDRLRVVRFRRPVKKDAPVQVLEVYPSKIIGTHPKVIQKLLNELLERYEEEDVEASLARQARRDAEFAEKKQPSG